MQCVALGIEKVRRKTEVVSDFGFGHYDATACGFHTAQYEGYLRRQDN